MAGGFTTDGDPTLGFNARLTLHDLADPADGYPDYASLEFLPVSARVVFAPDRVRFRLDDAQFVRIASLSPQTSFEHKMSWKGQVGAVYLDDSGCHICTAFRLSGGGGGALATAGGGLLGWVMSDAQLVSARGLNGIDRRPDPVRVGAVGRGPRAAVGRRGADGHR